MLASGYKRLNGVCQNNTTLEVKERSGAVCSKSRSKLKILSVIFIVSLSIILICMQVLTKPVVKNSSQAVHALKPQEITAGSPGKIRYKHTKRRLPQCLIIGARKAGTRALLTFLNLHPQIQTAKNEVHFFDNEEQYAQGEDFYRKKMPYSFPDQITIEKTPAYFVEEAVPGRVHSMNHSMKMLLIVRDPVERTISDYVQILANKEAKKKAYKSFEDMALTEDGEIDKTYAAIRRSIYARHMAKWLLVFPLEQFHIVSGEGLIERPAQHIYEIEKFLGVDHRITEENFFFNETRGFYCIRNETMEKCLAASKGREHPRVNPQVMRKLRAFFKPWNERFYQMVNKNFGWL